MERFIRSVAQFIDRNRIKKLYGTHLDMNIRYFNIVLTLLIVFPLLSAVYLFCIGCNYQFSLVLILVSIFNFAMFVIANSCKKYYVVMSIVLYLFDFFMLPLVYVCGGGLKYGFWVYFVIGVFLSIFFLKNELLIMTVSLQIVVYSFLICYNYSHNEISEFVFKLLHFNTHTYPEHVINIINFILAAFCIGIVIKSVLVSYIDVHSTELRLVDKLEKQTVRDPLTGTHNRRYLYKYLDSLVKDSQKNHVPFSIIMFDIDHFKGLNDTYGHLIGDEVLCKVSKIFIDALREYDVVARYGGEEFVVVLPGAKKSDAEKRANQIREEILKTKYNEKITKPVTISGGVAEFALGMNSSKIIKTADGALYDAKRSGRNKIICANTEDFINNKSHQSPKNTKKKEVKETKVIICE